MKNKLKSTLERLYSLTATRGFFISILVLFLVNALWLVFSAVFPLPFDEHFHYHLIEVYARQWSPFISDQPPLADMLGDVTRESSYLYHYLMSFPYRIADIFLDTRMSLVIAMRLFNVAFVAGAIVLFRRLFLYWKLSPRIVNIALLAFISTPMVILLAAHVNYDNLMLLGAPVFFMAATKIIKNDDELLRNLILFISLAITILLIKRTFLPVAAVAAVYLAVILLHRHGKEILSAIGKSWAKTKKNAALFLLVFWLLISLGLLFERYGLNIIRYGDMWPACDKMQTVEVCSNWGPWRRDRIDIEWLRPDTPPYGNVFSYGQHWVAWIMEGYFVLFSHQTDAEPRLGDPYGTIEDLGYLPIPKLIASAALILGILAVTFNFRRIWDNPYLRFALIVSIGFLVLQFAWNYKTYLRLWRPVAAQARYAYPILLLSFVVMTQAVSWQLKNRIQKGILVAIFLVLYVWGGGAAGWIIRSPETWEWQRTLVHDVNNTASNVLRYLVIH